ncbi:MAG TPA: hypothetical protein VF861_12690, partial [Telluria sp.]
HLRVGYFFVCPLTSKTPVDCMGRCLLWCSPARERAPISAWINADDSAKPVAHRRLIAAGRIRCSWLWRHRAAGVRAARRDKTARPQRSVMTAQQPALRARELAPFLVSLFRLEHLPDGSA